MSPGSLSWLQREHRSTDGTGPLQGTWERALSPLHAGAVARSQLAHAGQTVHRDTSSHPPPTFPLPTTAPLAEFPDGRFWLGCPWLLLWDRGALGHQLLGTTPSRPTPIPTRHPGRVPAAVVCRREGTLGKERVSCSTTSLLPSSQARASPAAPQEGCSRPQEPPPPASPCTQHSPSAAASPQLGQEEQGTATGSLGEPLCSLAAEFKGFSSHPFGHFTGGSCGTVHM